MKQSLDICDRKILKELSANARISHSELGKKIHLSRNAVRQRIERLERDGVIRAYTVRLGDDTSAADNRVSAVIFVYRADRMRGGEVIKTIKNINETVSCEVLSGEFDLLVRLKTVKADRLREIWTIISDLPGVKDTVTSMVLA
nr:Lrp/AsnC family transcriptional regulator [uncultured Cohaesibacter sp.]